MRMEDPAMDMSALWIAFGLPLLAAATAAPGGPEGEEAHPTAGGEEGPPAAAWTVTELRDRQAEIAGPWLAFFESRSLRLGLYTLAAGSEDPQPVHDDDEIYHVLRGRASLDLDGREPIPVAPGSTVFVRAGVAHRFVEIEEDLEVLVVFAGGPEEP